MTEIQEVFKQAAADLDAIGAQWQDQLDLQALLAVSKPADLRRDLDDLVRDELGS